MMSMMKKVLMIVIGIFFGLPLWGCALGGLEQVPDQSMGNAGYPESQSIVFTSKHDGNWEIYSVRTETGRVSRLTETFLEEEGIAPSADGKHLAFVSQRDGDYEIYIMALDGSHQKRLTFSQGVDEKPVWLMDDSKILFESARDGNWEIYIMNADGTQQMNLSRTPEDEADPVLSPDGNRVVFKSKRDRLWQLYVMDIDGANVIPLADSEYREGAYDDPVWSPDGRQVAFVSNRDSNSEIYIMEVPEPNPFLRGEAGTSSGFISVPQNVTRHPARDENPVWSPDGSQIALVSDRHGVRKVYIVRPDGTGLSPLSSVPIYNGTPQWSPDGRWIAYIARNPRGPFIQLVNVADGRHGRLADRGGEKAELQWVPKAVNHAS